MSLPVPDQLTLYSLNAEDVPPKPEVPETATEFYGYPILGKVNVTEPADREMLMAAFSSGLGKNDDKVAGCFIPRHAIRALHDGQTTDYLICFMCARVVIFAGEERTSRGIDYAPAPAFSEYLTNAGITLAPGAEHY